ncbi:MAG: TadE/TadG family type IV pilus assembly protein [Gemmataceae bacterium]
MKTSSGKKTRRRSAAATVELAILLPFLCCMFVGAVDFARIFYFGLTVQNCARNGAYYASDYPNSSYLYNDIYGYTSVNDAIMRDASNLSPAPTYTVFYGTSPTGPFTLTSAPSSSGYVQVTVNWTFNLITNYPAFSSSYTLSRSCIMEMAPATPTFP